MWLKRETETLKKPLQQLIVYLWRQYAEVTELKWLLNWNDSEIMAHNVDSDRAWVKDLKYGSQTSGSQSNLALPSWWKVCFVHGDQTKYYRKLYGRKSHVRTLRHDVVVSSSKVSDADQDSM